MNIPEMTEIIKSLACEKVVLQEITRLSTIEFAEEVADTLNPHRHKYGFAAYLTLLTNIRALLLEDISPEQALESVQTGWSVNKILYFLGENPEDTGKTENKWLKGG